PAHRGRGRDARERAEASSPQARQADKGRSVRPRRRPAQVIAYFDTSAVVPLLVAERGSALVASLWDGADRAVSGRVAYPEARAALAQAHRLGRLTARQLRDAGHALGSLFE